jgi:hypothetical protein
LISITFTAGLAGAFVAEGFSSSELRLEEGFGVEVEPPVPLRREVVGMSARSWGTRPVSE